MFSSGLKKVTDDMKTHKNPALRTGPKPFVAPKPGAQTSPNADKKEVKHNPKLELVGGKKWAVVCIFIFVRSLWHTGCMLGSGVKQGPGAREENCDRGPYSGLQLHVIKT